MLKVLSISLLLCCSLPFQGQTPGIILENPLNSEESTIDSQHKFIMEQSRTYVNNKVVKIEWIEKFYSNVKDSLESAKYESSNFEKAYSEEIKVSKDALISVTALKKELASVNFEKEFEKENITFFGSFTSKSSYKTIVWIIIISLLTFLLFFLFKFKSSNRATKEAKEKLKEIEFELEETKKKSRIKEQELMRKLQDEINKNS
jgi:hypothetical protein